MSAIDTKILDTLETSIQKIFDRDPENGSQKVHITKCLHDDNINSKRIKKLFLLGKTIYWVKVAGYWGFNIDAYLYMSKNNEISCYNHDRCIADGRHPSLVEISKVLGNCYSGPFDMDTFAEDLFYGHHFRYRRRGMFNICREKYDIDIITVTGSPEFSIFFGYLKLIDQ